MLSEATVLIFASRLQICSASSSNNVILFYITGSGGARNLQLGMPNIKKKLEAYCVFHLTKQIRNIMDHEF
jgi:hypothetical protein